VSKRKRPDTDKITSVSGRGPKPTMPLPHEVDLGKGLNPWGFQRKLKPNDTASMVEEEAMMLAIVAEHQPMKLWDLLNQMGRLAGPHKYQSRSQRQKLIPLSTRLCREGKLVRVRKANSLIIGPKYVPVAPRLNLSEPPDFCGALRHVPGVGSLVA
jgi:hypothetical protein